MSNDLITIFMIGIIFVIFILLLVLAYMSFKEKMKKKENSDTNNKQLDEAEERKAQKSIFQFMEFDKIEDNMIVQDDGNKYLMVIECKGVNYDLLSTVEQTSIEEGFISVLNGLKYEIQIYIQTKKINLSQSTSKYRERLKLIENDMYEEENKFKMLQRNPNITREEYMRAQKEVTKKRNLYEYSKDIIENTEQMSEDRDLTTKEYYIIVPYYTDEITASGDFSKKEISRMAFSELYTRAQALVNSLTSCDVRGKIMNSQELVELLFIAFNRDQHDNYDFEEYMTKSGYNSLYSVTDDVLEKRMRAIEDEIVKKAQSKATEAYSRVLDRNAKMKAQIQQRLDNIDKYVDAVAEQIVDNDRNSIGESNARKTKEEIRRMSNEKNSGEKSNDIKEKAVPENNEIEENIVDNSSNNDEKKKSQKRPLTEEERIRRAKLLRRRKLLKEREAMKNENNN